MRFPYYDRILYFEQYNFTTIHYYYKTQKDEIGNNKNLKYSNT